MHSNCTCPESLSHSEELCETCRLEYIEWLETDNLSIAELEAYLDSAAERSNQRIAELRNQLEDHHAA